MLTESVAPFIISAQTVPALKCCPAIEGQHIRVDPSLKVARGLVQTVGKDGGANATDEATCTGALVGDLVGDLVGLLVGAITGAFVGGLTGAVVGDFAGDLVGLRVGDFVGAW